MSSSHKLALYATPEHPCSYLPDQQAISLFIDPDAQIPLHTYSQLSELGFRRSGHHYYRPHCRLCSACIPVRVAVADFEPNRTQKRIWQKGSAITAAIQSPDFHEDQYLLYEKYISQRHANGDMYPPSREQYRSFLIQGVSTTRFVELSIGENLLAIAVTDELEDGLSAIYTFYDPEQAEFSPGTYAILWQIEEARRRNLKYLYLGYFIRDCRKMRYKTQFQPYEARINERWMSQQEMRQIIAKPLNPDAL